MRMNIVPLIGLVALVATSASAETLLAGDAAKGKATHEAKCVGCHVEMFGGDGSKIYTRKDRKTKTAEGLIGRVQGCNKQTGANLSKADVDNVVNFLNTTYYKF